MARPPKVTEAAEHIRAVELQDGTWAHYATETARWYIVTTDDLERLHDALHSEHEAVANDAYSRWCAECPGYEQPKGWEPSIPEQRSTSY